ncbi:hypothetical protein HELRODRAFT_169535 [Helobdella robusta]|uniref:MADF domain-containing protein n=1 Tax=Helobdella robusta TaxID=6412 RepID=T1F220_HELRO|nr:hypothetical protein HELRODRAFT_169535 [Helobdella robusta]ESO08647.1 hypothetical protein HELRODRAFT_169535 [Helobdella robusta]
MDWFKEDVFRLIDLYRDRPCLWDNDDIDRRDRNRKDECWNEIADLLQVDRAEIERKMKSLSTQFYREYKRKMKIEAETGSDEGFKSKWFAYERLSFLSRRVRDRPTICYYGSEEVENGASGEDGFNDMIKFGQMVDENFTNNEQSCFSLDENNTPKSQNNNINNIINNITNNSHTTTNNNNNSSNNSNSGSHGVKRKYSQDTFYDEHFNHNNNHNNPVHNNTPSTPPSHNSTIVNNNNNSSNISSNNNNMFNNKDEFQIYGEFVACKLRSLPSQLLRSTVQHRISDVIYQAEIGNFDNYNVNSGSAYDYHSPRQSCKKEL